MLGFRREVDENCVLLSYYAANSGKLLLTMLDISPIFRSQDFALKFRSPMSHLASLRQGSDICGQCSLN